MGYFWRSMRFPMTLLAVFLAIGSAYSQPSDVISFKTFDLGSGNSLTLPSDILQDRDGFIWITSDEGRSQFDGTACRQFRPGDVSDYRASGKAWLAQDSTGCLWVLHHSGLAWYSKSQQKFNYLAGAITEPMNADLMAVRYDSARHCLWLGTNAGLYRFDIATRRMHKTAVRESGNCVALLPIDQGLLAYVTMGKVIYYDPTRNTFRGISVPGKAALGSYYDPTDQVIWLGLEEQGLLRLNPRTNRAKFYKQKTSPYASIGKFPAISGDSILWLGTMLGSRWRRLAKRPGRSWTP